MYIRRQQQTIGEGGGGGGGTGKLVSLLESASVVGAGAGAGAGATLGEADAGVSEVLGEVDTGGSGLGDAAPCNMRLPENLPSGVVPTKTSFPALPMPTRDAAQTHSLPIRLRVSYFTVTFA